MGVQQRTEKHGRTSCDWFKILRNVSVFQERSQLSFKQLNELLAAESINPRSSKWNSRETIPAILRK